LFRSKNFNHSVVELVIVVTATVVDPLTVDRKEAVKEPRFVVPNLDAAIFDASAQHEARQAAPSTGSQPPSMQTQGSGGR
ncbi:MAG TPA: hypothetical protein VGU23_07915, partial [Acidobacteriaceae bacterium]|nr:hypothetical protein [Acidobacteriaceae bacterium]